MLNRRCCRGGNTKWNELGCGRRSTMPRKYILKVLQNTDRHLNAEEIFWEIKKELPGIGQATIYRNLELLRRGGLLGRVDAGDGKARYELKLPDNESEHHHHLICTACGQVKNYMDFEEEELMLVRKIEAHLARKFKYKVNGHDITFYGACPKCNIKKTNNIWGGKT